MPAAAMVEALLCGSARRARARDESRAARHQRRANLSRRIARIARRMRSRSTAAEAMTFDGVRFFVTRAEEAAAFVLEDHNASTVVVHIARRLDGIPLAIELATARLRAMTVQQLGERLDASFRAALRRQPHRDYRASKRCARSSIGVTSCSVRRSGYCCSRGSPSLPERGRSRARPRYARVTRICPPRCDRRSRLAAGR